VRVTAAVQARTGSTRLPGKVLAPVAGRPMLRFLLDRLASAPVDALVVATSDQPGDDAVAAVTEAAGVACVRGPEDDVLARLGVALDAFPADCLVRITGDCPLMDPGIVGSAIDLQRATGADYVSNTLIRTFPDGLDVEVVAADAFRRAIAEATAVDEREHVTPFVYRHPEQFSLAALRSPELAGDERWTVDTADDLAFVQHVASLFQDDTSFSWLDVLATVGRRVDHGAELWLRPAIDTDCDFVLDLRNDDVAVRFSVTGTTVDRAGHREWFTRRLTDPATRIWIAVVDDQRVGQARVDVVAGVGTVSIAVAPDHRGKGHATAMLLALQAALRADLQVKVLRAEIHRENESSVRAFAKAGFIDSAASRPDGFLELHWMRQ
jgi:spore coat polysaccharide biosynthesis protein SpsF